MRKYLVFSFLMFVLVFSFVQVGLAESGSSENEHWLYSIKEDPMTDEIQITFVLVDEKNIGDNFNIQDAKGIAFRKLPEYEPELYVSWPDDLDNNKIRWRFDKGDIQTGNWNMAQNETTLFHPGTQAEIMNFVKKMIEAEQIVIEVKPHEKKRDPAIFLTAGLGEVIEPYLNEFGWEELESVIENQ